MRSSSGGKFSLGSAFGRRGDKHDRTGSYSGSNDFGVASTGEPTQTTSRINGASFNEQPDSPNARSGGEGGGSASGGVQLKKLGKTFAHNNLLPGLGNKDLKALQDVISAEKGVLLNTEKLAIETQKAASVLPNYGLQEGPDLQDILTQSSHLLNYFSAALNVYAERQVSLRGSYKKIRDREEELLELRSQRRSTGSKAEQAERKLAKMGPENKGLVSQTELLERLRQEMRSMDSQIVQEETGLGDFKRQIVKEAFMYKFSGLEELGEKLCIIGEMGKLVIDEIPLEETPVGYGRAPYGGFTKTETAVEEAGRCLGQVKFAAVETNLKPSHLPHAQHLPGRSSVLHRQESISAAEEFAHFPAGMASPQTPGRPEHSGGYVPPPNNAGAYGLDENPYGGIDNRATNSQNAYGEYGGVRAGDNDTDSRRQTLWQGPTEDALRQQNRASDGIEYASARIASMYGAPNGSNGVAAGTRGPSVSFGPIPTPTNPHQIAEEGPDYEHQQQAEMDRQQEQEQAAWRDQSDRTPLAGQHEAPLPNPYDTDRATAPGHEQASAALSPPWQPLNVKRDKSVTPEPRSLQDPPVSLHVNEPTTDSAPGPGAYTQSDYHSESHSVAHSELLPPPSMAQLHARAPTPGTEGFRTPAESPNLDATSFSHSAPTVPQPTQFALQSPITAAPASPPLPIPVPMGFAGPARPASPSAMSPVTGGKISAGAFRKAAPRRSETAATAIGDEDGAGSDVGRGSRKLPVPPGGYTPGVAGPSGLASPGINAPGAWPDEKRALVVQNQENSAGADVDRDAPPSYGHAAAGQHDESLR